MVQFKTSRPTLSSSSSLASTVISFDDSISKALQNFTPTEDNNNYHSAPSDNLKFNFVWNLDATSEVSDLSPDQASRPPNPQQTPSDNAPTQMDVLNQIIAELRQSNLHQKQQNDMLLQQNQALQQQIMNLSQSYHQLLSQFQLLNIPQIQKNRVDRTSSPVGVQSSPLNVHTSFEFSTPTQNKDSSVKRTLSYSESVKEDTQFANSQKKQNNKPTPVKNSKNWGKPTSTNQRNDDLSMDSTLKSDLLK